MSADIVDSQARAQQVRLAIKISGTTANALPLTMDACIKWMTVSFLSLCPFFLATERGENFMRQMLNLVG